MSKTCNSKKIIETQKPSTRTPNGMPFGGFYVFKNLHKASFWGSR